MVERSWGSLRRGGGLLLCCAAWMSSACGGANQPAQAPVQEESAPVAPPPPEPEPEPEEGSGETRRVQTVDPEFRPGMSVNEAIDAVPRDAQRLELEQDVLAGPLLNMDVYAPCLKGNQHFELRVAVWDGRAVGIDVTPRPANDKLAACVREQVEKLSWPDKVKSLNTVAFSL